jgi:hypothetical protein
MVLLKSDALEARVREGRWLISLASSSSRFLLRLEDEDADEFSSCTRCGGGRIASVGRGKTELASRDCDELSRTRGVKESVIVPLKRFLC